MRHDVDAGVSGQMRSKEIEVFGRKDPVGATPDHVDWHRELGEVRGREECGLVETRQKRPHLGSRELAPRSPRQKLTPRMRRGEEVVDEGQGFVVTAQVESSQESRANGRLHRSSARRDEEEPRDERWASSSDVDANGPAERVAEDEGGLIEKRGQSLSDGLGQHRRGRPALERRLAMSGQIRCVNRARMGAHRLEHRSVVV